MKKRIFLGALLALVSISNSAIAQPLTANITADDELDLFIGNTPVTGQPPNFGSDDIWQNSQQHIEATLPQNDFFLFIEARDRHRARVGFLGSFTLGDPRWSFANGTQNLITDTLHWEVSMVDFTTGFATPILKEVNGGSTWGTIAGIDPAAEWIWADCPPATPLCTSFFRTPIFFNAEQVPAPAPIALLGLGLLLIRLTRRREA